MGNQMLKVEQKTKMLVVSKLPKAQKRKTMAKMTMMMKKKVKKMTKMMEHNRNERVPDK